MTISTDLSEIYSKVFQLSTMCSISITPLNPLASSFEIRQFVLNILSQTIDHLSSLKQIQNEYKKLEQSIQKKQADIRKHIGLEQQLKLYSESLEQQLEDSELARSQFIEKSRIMISDLKRSNHFLHEQNAQLREKINFNENRSRNRTFNINPDLKRHMRTESSKDQLQKTHSKNKFADIYSSCNKNSEQLKSRMESMSSMERKKEIQKKIKQLNQKVTIEEHQSSLFDKLYSNCSYNELYNQREGVSKKAQKGAMKKNNSSKKSYVMCYEDKRMVEKTHHKTRSIQSNN